MTADDHSKDTGMTADELVIEGKRRLAMGHLVVFLYPSQEWIAVKEQVPFLRYDLGLGRK